MCARKKETKRYKEIRNSKASHEYFVDETLECGLILKGTEVKAVRQGLAQISDAFIRIDKRRAWMYHANIPEYALGNFANHNPFRPRELLMHASERRKWELATQQGGYTVIPLRMYFKNGIVKIQAGLCRGKKQYDKRAVTRKAEDEREIQRTMRAALR